MASLQDQLLKAGLVDEKKAKQTKKDKRKQTRVNNKSKTQQVDEAKVAAQQALAEKAERDRALNRERQEQAEIKAIAAQVKQLIDMNKVKFEQGDIGYNFVDDDKIKKLYVTKKLQNQLSIGLLTIAKVGSGDNKRYEVVPRPVAEKIAERMPEAVVLINEKAVENTEEDEWYSDYEVPDDLMW